ncbi:DUF4012 domain-containing protein [Candidatus Peregrinibacteria bacterium]|nr:DUF4012 domain-containing protein [Candidatus Peregrinibacteria bacterium]
MKKIRDLKFDPQNERVNLKGDLNVKKEPIGKNRANLKKQSSGVHHMKDISGEKQEHYIYIRGKKFTPPQYLGNLLRIGISGFLIIVVLNGFNVYYAGKKLAENISAEAYEGYSYLIDAGKSATKIQFSEALKTFEKASRNFSDAKDQLWFINTDRTFYAEYDNMGHAVTALLEGGKHFAKAGAYFLEAVEEFNKIPLYFVARNTAGETEHGSVSTDPLSSISSTVRNGLNKTNIAIEEISAAAELIEKVDENRLPENIAARITFAKRKISEIIEILQSTSEHFPALLKLMGDGRIHRYLVLLQNNNEIRPSGGFIGSYAVVEVKDGYIEKLETYDVYDIDNAYKPYIKPPEEFLNFTKNWRFRDSNYSQDFSLTAKKASWFLELEGGPKIDTVIAINQGLLRDMLEISGPVQVGNFGKLTAENYNLLLSYVIESKMWGAEDPKHILKVFIPAFKNAIMKTEHLSRAGLKLYRALEQKHVMMYSSDDDIQAFFDAMGFSGRVHQTAEKEDYLSVINISFGGTKSDGFVEENISHDTSIAKNGDLIDEITIKRRHLWTDDLYVQWRKTLAAYGITRLDDGIIDILGRGRNAVVIKIYVPDGSILMESNGADVVTKYDSDLKKTYFLTSMEMKYGESGELKIKYRLPFTLDFTSADTYKLIVEKQPGSRGSLFKKTVHSADGLENLGIYPAEAFLDEDGTATYSTNLVYDRYFSGIWK